MVTCNLIPFGVESFFFALKIEKGPHWAIPHFFRRKKIYSMQTTENGCTVLRRLIFKFSRLLISGILISIARPQNMLCITFWAHSLLLITLAIGANFYFAPQTLCFQIFCPYFGPSIIICLPNSGEVWAHCQLMPHAYFCPSALTTGNIRAYTNLIIHNAVGEHFQS